MGSCKLVRINGSANYGNVAKIENKKTNKKHDAQNAGKIRN